jgi:glycopeptide antibiotics resistance protein
MDWWNELFLIICKDMGEPISYAPWGIAAGVLSVIFIGIYTKLIRDRISCRKLIFWFLMAFYVTILAIIVFFSREPGSRTGVNLQLMGTWGTTVQSHGYVVENVLLFIPMGGLLPCCIKPMRNVLGCILAGLICSVSIELIQLATLRGYCQLDDVVMNTVGTALGWCVFWIVNTAAGS